MKSDCAGRTSRPDNENVDASKRVYKGTLFSRLRERKAVDKPPAVRIGAAQASFPSTDDGIDGFDPLGLLVDVVQVVDNLDLIWNRDVRPHDAVTCFERLDEICQARLIDIEGQVDSLHVESVEDFVPERRAFGVVRRGIADDPGDQMLLYGLSFQDVPNAGLDGCEVVSHHNSYLSV